MVRLLAVQDVNLEKRSSLMELLTLHPLLSLKTICMKTAEKLPFIMELSIVFVLISAVLALYIPTGFRTLPLVISLVYIYVNRKEMSIDKDLKIWLIVFLSFVLLFTLSAENTASARKGLYDILRGCIYFLPGYYFGKRLLVHEQYSWILVLLSLLLVGNFLIPHEPFDFYGYQSNPNNTAFGVAVLMVFMLPVLFLPRKRMVNIAIGSAGIMMGLVLLYYANSRGAWIALFMSLMVLTIMRSRTDRRLIAALFLLEALCLGIVLIYFNNKGFAMPVRVTIWSELIAQTVNNHFWLGYGINNTKEVLIAAGLPALMAHNLFVDVFVSTGFIGLVVFIFVGIYGAWVFSKRSYHINTAFYIGVSGFVMFGFISMFDLKFSGLQFIGTIAYFLGVIYSQSRSKWKCSLGFKNGDPCGRRYSQLSF